MRPDPLLPGLPDLERALAGRTCPEPPAGLRDRVLAAVSAERHLGAPRPPRNPWNRVWQATAAVVLALNLGMSAANGVRYQRLAPLPPAEGNLARRVAPGVPDAADAEDRFGLLAARALASLTPAPDVGALGRNCFRQ